MSHGTWASANDAPHGKVFYGLMCLLGALGVVFFVYVAVVNPTESALTWRILYAARTPVYLLGMLLAFERLFFPERARVRAEHMSEGEVLRILLARWITLGVALGGFILASVAGYLSGPEWQDVWDNLRILFLSFLFLCFSLADLVGEATFPQSMWTSAWVSGAADGMGGLAKRRRPRRSPY